MLSTRKCSQTPNQLDCTFPLDRGGSHGLFVRIQPENTDINVKGKSLYNKL
jgi:hypothetical protein